MAKTNLGAQLRRAGHYTVYVVFRMIEGVLRLLPLDFVWRIGAVLGWLAYFIAGKYRRLAVSNLGIAFGREMSGAEIRALARKHFSTMGANLLSGFKLPLMQQEEILKRVRVEGQGHIEKVAASGKPLIFAIMHLSCWELLTRVPSLFTAGRKPASVFQPLGNPYLDAAVRQNRERLGYILFDRSKGFAEPLKFLRGGNAAIGILVDQHAGDKGVWCPFFDRLASTTPLAALMALRCDAPLLPLAVLDDGVARWRLVCGPPVESGEEKPTAEGLTAALNLVVEKFIRLSPANWFWVHNRWKTPRPDFLLSEYHRGVVFPKGYDRDRLQPFHLLVRSPNWLGDACMAFPAARALKAGRPDLKLTVIAPAKLRELWASLPEVDGIIAKESADSVFTVARRIRETHRFDAAVLFTNSTRSTLEIWLSGIPRLAGYRGSLRSWMLGQIAPEPKCGRPPEHHAHRYLRLAGHTGAKSDDAALFDTSGAATADDGITRIGICAGAEYGPAKRWPLERFAEVVNTVGEKNPGIQWQLFGAPGEAAMGEKLSGMIRARHVNLVGKTNLTELIAKLRACRLLVTNDTGTMHLAAALGVPTVSIFGSTEPVLTGPLGAHHTVIRHQVPCSPCFKRECPFGHYDCMTGVTVERVVGVVNEKVSHEGTKSQRWAGESE
jgi:lipopolysaccharide heptosyltransferase II